MHTRHLVVVALLALVGPVIVIGCAAPVESDSDPGEPIGEAQQPLVCECSVSNDWCATIYGSGHCVLGFGGCTKTPKYGCGTLGLYPCTGWCVRP